MTNVVEIPETDIKSEREAFIKGLCSKYICINPITNQRTFGMNIISENE